MRTTTIALALSAGAALFGAGCGRHPTPLNPAISGSIGTANKGMLRDGVEIKNAGDVRWLRSDGHHFGLPRFVKAIERAASNVAKARPGAALYVGDLSAQRGGRLAHHASHVSGRDADLLLYVTTLDGVPIKSPGFVRFEADGLAWDPSRGAYIRFDVEREWLLIKSLLDDEAARVQWIFVHEILEAILIEYARARGDSAETILRAQEVMLRSGGPHDDHIHVRTDCAWEDVAGGCEPTGLSRPWLSVRMPREDKVTDLVVSLLQPIEQPLAARSP